MVMSFSYVRLLMFGLFVCCAILATGQETTEETTYLIRRPAVPTSPPMLEARGPNPEAALSSNNCQCIANPDGELLICDNFQSPVVYLFGVFVILYDVQ